MPVAPQFNSRSGMNKFLLLAQTLCRLVNLSSGVIRARYPDRTALLAVLTAAEGVCALLPAALSEQATEDALSSEQFNPGDATVIPGQIAP